MFNSEYNYTFIFNPFQRFIVGTSCNYSGVNEIKRETPVIVSLTSNEDNFDDLELSLYSLLNQTVKPDRLILWLSDEYDLSYLPYNITKYIKNGLEIKFVKDLNTYTNIIYPLKQFPKAINVIANDCVYYAKDWLMKLYHSYIANPREIHTHIAHKITIDTNSRTPLHYAVWQKCINNENAEYTHFAKIDGGILYPPLCFSNEVFRDDVFLKNNITNPEIWLWVMGILSNKKVRIVKNHINTIKSTRYFKDLLTDKRKQYPKYDEQIRTLIKYYSQNILPKLNS